MHGDKEARQEVFEMMRQNIPLSTETLVCLPPPLFPPIAVLDILTLLEHLLSFFAVFVVLLLPYSNYT